jgi:hypothetical protein
MIDIRFDKIARDFSKESTCYCVAVGQIQLTDPLEDVGVMHARWVPLQIFLSMQ